MFDRATRARVDGVRVPLTVNDVEVAVVTRCRHRAVQKWNRAVQAPAKIRGFFDTDGPGGAFRVQPGGTNFATDLNQVVGRKVDGDALGHAIDRVALGDRRQVDPQVRVRLANRGRIESHSQPVPSDVLTSRGDLFIARQFCAICSLVEVPKADQWRDGNIEGPCRRFGDLMGELHNSRRFL